MNPNAEGFAVNPKRRMLHFDINVIHISKSGNIESLIKCLTPTKFTDAISEEEPKERSGTLIAKDLSRAMINSLGTEYELEPEFFANHLEGKSLIAWALGNPQLCGLLPEHQTFFQITLGKLPSTQLNIRDRIILKVD